MTQTVYTPPPKHSHDLPRRGVVIGEIVKCTCNKYFYTFDLIGISYPSAVWTPVRWYMWRKRKIIKEWENK